jgi:hypothetical protein
VINGKDYPMENERWVSATELKLAAAQKTQQMHFKIGLLGP